MNTYRTSEVAAMIGIHPNTVRLYEELGLIPRPVRQTNGYRVFTDIHIEQLKLARLAFEIEVIQNGLRKKIIKMVKISAAGDYDTALKITQDYLAQVRQEIMNAEEAIEIVYQILNNRLEDNSCSLRRKEVSKRLNISMDTLRNWEMNGLLTVKRKQNGYRVYTDEDIKRLKIIRSLRCANYSLQSILSMLNQLSENPDIDIKNALDTPNEETEIIAACDKLLTSLTLAEHNAGEMLIMLHKMKSAFKKQS